MNSQRLSLDERLRRMANGCVAPEYIASAIQAMANIPIAAYLHDFELERARVMELIGPWGGNRQHDISGDSCFRPRLAAYP